MYLLNTYYAQNGKSNTVKILKNREFESLRPRIWREIAERKPRVRENRELGNREVGGITVECFQLSFDVHIVYVGQKL